jgi:hypothetical protein
VPGIPTGSSLAKHDLISEAGKLRRMLTQEVRDGARDRNCTVRREVLDTVAEFLKIPILFHPPQGV